MTPRVRRLYRNEPNLFPPQPNIGEHWQDAGLCTQTDITVFFPHKGGKSREAKLICASCPVVEECLAFALNNYARDGIWGGTTPLERRRIARERGLDWDDVA